MERFPLYLYDSNFLVLLGLPFLLLIFLFRPNYLAALIVAITFLRPNERFNIPFAYSYLIFALLLFSLLINNRKFREIKYTKDYSVLALYVAFIMLQTIVYHMYNFQQNLLRCGLGLLVYVYVTVILSTNKGFKLACHTFLISSFLICFEPFYYHCTEQIHSMLWDVFHTINGRLLAWGMWANSNELSFVANIGVISSMLILLSNKRQTLLSIILYGGLAIFFFIIICLTSSRTGLGCFLLIFVGMVLCIKSTPMKILMVVIIASVIIIAPMITPQREESEKVASSSERFDLRYSGIQMFKAHPLLGVGFNRAQHETGNSMVLHNTYVQAFAETGIIGGGLFIYFIYLIGIDMLRQWKTYRREAIFSISNGLPGMYLCILLYLLYGNQLLSVMFYNSMALMKIASKAKVEKGLFVQV